MFKNYLRTSESVVKDEGRQIYSCRPLFESPGFFYLIPQSWRCWWKPRAEWMLLKMQTQILKKHMLSPSLVTGIDLAAVHFAYLCSQAITRLPRHRIYYAGWHKVCAKWLHWCLGNIRGITTAHDTEKNLVKYMYQRGLNTAKVSNMDLLDLWCLIPWAFGYLMFWPRLLMSQRNTR